MIATRLLDSPSRLRSTIAYPPPTAMAIAPAVVVNAFAPTSESLATVCGVEADSPDPTNRPTPMMNSAVTNNTALGRSSRISSATSSTRTHRIRLAQTITRRRLHRSSSAPANGPMIEYGNSSTANPAAISAGLDFRSGLNSTNTASAPWKAPSPKALKTLTYASRRSPRTSHRCFRPRTEGRADAGASGVRGCGVTVERYAPGTPLVLPLPGDRWVPAQARALTGRMGCDERAMREIDALRAGTLLVAAPELRDPHFCRTVVYLVAHGDDGTVGVILNRPSETAVHNVLPAWAAHAARPQAVFAGGPVQTTSAMCLGVCRTGTNPRDVDGVVSITGPVVLVDLDADPAMVAGATRGIRIYAGRAGWDAQQLIDEVVEGAWHVVPACPTMC